MVQIKFDKENELKREPFVLGKLFRRNGVYDHKLFHSGTKVTYTFVDDEQIIALHFDRSKQAIYYKGHNIQNLNLTPQQVKHLEQFQVELGKNSETLEFFKAFSGIWIEFKKDHALS